MDVRPICMARTAYSCRPSRSRALPYAAGRRSIGTRSASEPFWQAQQAYILAQSDFRGGLRPRPRFLVVTHWWYQALNIEIPGLTIIPGHSSQLNNNT